MSAPRGPNWTKRGVIVAIGLAVATMICTTLNSAPSWIPFLEERGYDAPWLSPSLRWVQRWWLVLLASAALVLVACLLLLARRPAPRAVRRLSRLGKRVRWSVLWLALEADVRASIAGLGQIGAEVLAATLRLGERRQDRRLFLSIPEAEDLVRRRRRPPQAGIGGRAWAKKGCEELRAAGLVERFADARNHEYMLWLEPRLLKSRLAGRMADAVDGRLAWRGWWRWERPPTGG
jgi:hypothetical protein